MRRQLYMRERHTSEPIGYHVIMRLGDSRVIAESAAQRRIVAGVLFEQGAKCLLLAFAIVDTHIHALLICSREAAGLFARYSAGACVAKLELASRFERARIRPVRDQQHLANTFWYVLRQASHHGVAGDPFHEGTSLPDLLGMRLLGRRLRTAVRAKLPRVTAQALRDAFKLSLDPQPLDLSLLADSAAAALGLPNLHVPGRLAQRAREAAVVVAGSVVETAELARALGISRRTVVRFRHKKVSTELRNAVTLQLAARAALKLERTVQYESLADHGSVATLDAVDELALLAELERPLLTKPSRIVAVETE